MQGGMNLSPRGCASHPQRLDPGTRPAARGRVPLRPAACACSARA
jgi:hypothetical protein